MAKIYLLSPPYGHVYKKINLKGFGVAHPPLGLAYIASFLKSRGHEVELFDGAFSKDIFKDIAAHIRRFDPDFVCLTATTPQINNAFAIAKSIKASSPSRKILLGGPHASALPEDSIANPDIDIVVCGEGEVTVSEIAEGKNPDDIKGICYRKNGKVIITAPRPLIENLDALPFPLWEQLPVHRYYYFPEKALSVLSGRGCPHRCSFCASGVVHRYRYRTRSPANFVDEIEWLYKTHGIRYFYFADETFILEPGRVKTICRLILDRKLPIRWTCDARVDRLTEEILRVMKQARCKMIRIGVESADEGVLKATGKGITLEQVENVTRWADKLGIRVVGYFILGLPHETPATLRKTLEFAGKLDLFYAQFGMLVPLPGTPVWSMAKEGKLLRCVARDWGQFTRFDKPIVESDTLSLEQLSRYHRQAVRGYHLNFLFILRTIRRIRSFRELLLYAKGGIGVLKMARKN